MSPTASPDRLVVLVREALRPVQTGTTVVVGVSGGPDSQALLSLLATARTDLVIVVGHVRHGLRDDRADLAAASAGAQAVGAQFCALAVEVSRSGDGLEAAAREARHGALQTIARTQGAAAVLLGHTMEDQAETLLLRLARGTTLRGAAGMRPWRTQLGGVALCRPMLGARRAEVHAWAARPGRDVPPIVTDPTNDDPAFARNVVRATVLPALAIHAGDPAAALARFAVRANEDDDHLSQLAAAALEEHARLVDGEWLIAPQHLYDAAPAIGRRMIAQLLRRVRPGAGAVSGEIDDILALAVNRRVDRRGVIVARGGASVRFTPGKQGPGSPAL
jgi:tRNA(Ile)-lysidine synthase